MNELISIVIPVYNAEKTIKRCVDSVVSQSYTDLEIILIDDGSKDGSAKICDGYAQSDNRVKVKHIENGGVSNARNIGLDTATGEYVTFVDSDDSVEVDFVKK